MSNTTNTTKTEAAIEPTTEELFGNATVHTPENQYQNNQAENWNIPENKEFVIVNMPDGKIKVRVLWSEKLGLQLKYDFASVENAQAKIDQLYATKIMVMAGWDKVFFPSEGFIKGEGFEPSLVIG